jgi:transposase
MDRPEQPAADRTAPGQIAADTELTLQMVKRLDDLYVFTVLPRRWVVERALAWTTRHRRTSGTTNACWRAMRPTAIRS